MQPVNVLPAFVSQDTDLKSKDSSGASADSKRHSGFSSLVEQHLPEENKVTDQKESEVHEQEDTATQGKNIASNGKNDIDENNSRQESDSKQLLDAGNTATDASVDGISNKDSKTYKEAVTNNVSLTESEQFIALLYNSDQTLTFSGEKNKLVKDTISVNSGQVNGGNINIVDIDINSKEGKTEVVASAVASANNDPDLTNEHKLKVFSKDELLAGIQLKNNNILATHASSQALKDYQLSLQSKQGGIKNDSITSQQLMNSQLVNTQLNNKMSDVATGVALASKNQLTEQVDSGLYQLPVEPIGNGKSIAAGISHSVKASVVRSEINQSEIDIELASKVSEETETSSTKPTNSSLEVKNVNLSNSDTVKSQLNTANVDKLIAERNSQVTVENRTKDHVLMDQIVVQEKQSVMTSAQLQALQQVQAQQKIESVTSEQQAVEDAGNEFIDSMLLAEEKPIELSMPPKSKVIDNIAMRSVSELQAHTVQATQTKQSNDAYLEHQVSEVLNHNVVSDIAQIQKNNTQLQQETISIFRKDFADAVKDKVMMTINQKLQQFDITLDPPEFGNMQVRVNLQGEQASVNFIVQNQQAKDTLDQNMHKLRDMLSEQGVDVGDANVEQQNQQQNNEEQKLQENNGNSAALTNGTQKDEHNIEHTLSTKLFDSSSTHVDYYA